MAVDADDGYLSNGLLSRLVGERLYSIEFVLNDYVQLRFDGVPGVGNPVVLSSFVWPEVERDGRRWRESDLGYADALRGLAPGTVSATAEETGIGIRIELDTGAVVINPAADEVMTEIAMIQGFIDGSWMAWRPGEQTFEDLA